MLVPKVSGKPRRRTDLARGVPSGTMARNRAAHPCMDLLADTITLLSAEPPGTIKEGPEQKIGKPIGKELTPALELVVSLR